MMMSENNHISLGTKVYFATIGDFTGIATTPAPAQPTQNELVEMIHSEFDSAPDRLLSEANEILNQPIDNTEFPALDPALKLKAERLHKLGFVNSAENSAVLKHRNDKLHHHNQITKQKYEREQVAKTVEIISHYKKSYPFSKFLTIEELNRICAKYGLIFAPASAYIRDVPDKNLAEIENAQALDIWDHPTEALQVGGAFFGSRMEISEAIHQAMTSFGAPSFSGSTMDDLLNYLNRYSSPVPKKEVVNPSKIIEGTVSLAMDWPYKADGNAAGWVEIYNSFSPKKLSYKDLRDLDLKLRERVKREPRKVIDPMFSYGEMHRSISELSHQQVTINASLASAMANFSAAMMGSGIPDILPPRRKYTVSDNCAFQIAAPADHFNLDPSKYQKTSGYGYQVKNDPIVFRYCRGGILVDSKWGLEASDPALLNPINN